MFSLSSFPVFYRNSPPRAFLSTPKWIIIVIDRPLTHAATRHVFRRFFVCHSVPKDKHNKRQYYSYRHHTHTHTTAIHIPHQGHKLTDSWIPSHSGIQGNEAMTKTALTLPTITGTRPCANKELNNKSNKANHATLRKIQTSFERVRMEYKYGTEARDTTRIE